MVTLQVVVFGKIQCVHGSLNTGYYLLYIRQDLCSVKSAWKYKNENTG